MLRREFLKNAGLGSLGLLTGGLPTLAWGKEPDIELVITARPEEVQILDGPPTRVWRYRGEVVRGPENTLSDIPGSYLGPTIRVHTGQRIRVRFRNEVRGPSIIHWHGLHVPDDMDGHPRFAVQPGGEYLYDFTVTNRAGTYWYHPHPHGLTGHQVYGGMAGLLIVTDREEAGFDLPSGEYEVPLVLQDRTFDNSNQLVYLRAGHERMTGFLGERIMVNGQPEPSLRFEPRPYRLRVLNGSNSRIYRLAWSDGRPLTIIGTDGGLLDEPATRESIMLGPGERLDLWENFGASGASRSRQLVSLPFNAALFGGTFPGVIPNGAGFSILSATVGEGQSDASPPKRFAPIAPYEPGDAVNPDRPKSIHLEMSHMVGLINGRRFEMTGVASDEIVTLGTTEIWEFINPFRGMGMMSMSMPHPMHLHGKQFRILERSGGSGLEHMDLGWKDTTLVMPGQRVRIAVSFDDYPGLFLYHCHNLEHEDMGMMRNYRVDRPSV